LTNNTPNLNKSGICKLTYNTCQMSYIGQTSKNLKQRYQEHVWYIRNNYPQSAYVQHILCNPTQMWPHQWHSDLTQTSTKQHC
jgi:hypothetical protein